MTIKTLLVCLGVLATSITASFSAYSQTDAPESPESEVVKIPDWWGSGSVFTFELKEGQNKEFYLDAFKEFENVWIRFCVSGIVPSKTVTKIHKVHAWLFDNLLKYDDLDPHVTLAVVRYFADKYFAEGKVEEFDVLIAKTSKLPQRPDVVNLLNSLKYLKFGSRAKQVTLSEDPDKYLALIDEGIEFQLRDPKFDFAFKTLNDHFYADKDTISPARKKAIEKFRESGNPVLCKQAEILEGKERFDNLKGVELNVNGVCVDDSKLNWEDYRGKVILLFFSNVTSMDRFKDVTKHALQDLYAKYREAGFEVVEYSVEKDPNKLALDLQKTERPWKVVSAVKTNSYADKDYKELSEYLNIDKPPVRILIGKDGKVVKTWRVYVNPSLEEFLKEQFPEVK